MRVAFVTVGDTGRKTGGYLYNARVVDGLRGGGVEVEEVVAGGADPEEQVASVPRVGAMLDPSSFDAIVVDALARIAVAPHLDRWRISSPVVALVHELPSVAGEDDRERHREAPLLRADVLVAVSEHGRSLLEARGVPPGRIRVVPPGSDRLTPPKVPPGRKTGPTRALCVAQWIPRKGISTLVEAWARRPRPGAALELVGEAEADPNYAVSVREVIAAASDASILVRGPVDDADLAAAYASADLFVLPSRYEGYGMVFAEALRFGLPVVACRIGPVPDLVGREVALLVPPDDAGALSEALDLLLADPGLRDRMSDAARRRAARLPRWRATVAGFREVLQSVGSQGVRLAGGR